MKQKFSILKTIINKTDDFIYFTIISLLVYYRTITLTDSLLYRTSLLILFLIIYIYICIKDKHNKLFTILYYNKILFFILVTAIIVFLYKIDERILLICFTTLILPLFMGFKGNTTLINFKYEDKKFAYILSFIYLLVFIQSSYFIHINDYFDIYLFPYTITLIMVAITTYLVVKFIQHHTAREIKNYFLACFLVLFFGIYARNLFAYRLSADNISNYAYFYVMIVLWVGYVFYANTSIKYIQLFKGLKFFIFTIWLIYFPFSFHSMCYFVSLDPQFYYLPEKVESSVIAVHNSKKVEQILPLVCQNKALNKDDFNKNMIIRDYIIQESSEDNSWLFNINSSQYKKLSEELKKTENAKKDFIHQCETKYFDKILCYSKVSGKYSSTLWDNVDDTNIIRKELSHKHINGRVYYDVYNYYDNETNLLLYSSKTHTSYINFIFYLQMHSSYLPYPDIYIISDLSY